MRDRGLLLVIFAVVFGVPIVGGFVRVLSKAGATAVLESWRTQPRRVVIVSVEILLILGAGLGFSTLTGWSGACCGIAGYVFGGLLVWTVWPRSRAPRKGRPAPQPDAPQKPVQYRPPRPPQQPQPESPEKPGPGKAAPSLRDAVVIGGVSQWREPVPEDPALRRLLYQHAVVYQEGKPEPAAICRYQYDPRDLADDGMRIWGLAVDKWDRCRKCTQLLRDAGQSIWNIEPGALGGW